MIVGEYIASIIAVDISIGDISRILPAACGRVVALPDSLPSAKTDAINQCGIVCRSAVERDVQDVKVIPGYSVGHVNSSPVDPINLSLDGKGNIVFNALLWVSCDLPNRINSPSILGNK